MWLAATSLGCAHAQPVVQASEGAADVSQAAPANEVRQADLIIREATIDAPAALIEGPITFSISNATRRERTVAVEGRGGPWRLERPIPPDRSMTLDVVLEPGDYLISSGEGEARLRAKLRVLKR